MISIELMEASVKANSREQRGETCLNTGKQAWDTAGSIVDFQMQNLFEY